MNKNDKSYQDALEKIKKAKAAQAIELDLAGFGLTTLPPEIGQLTSLKSLSLRYNQLKIFPPAIGQLTGLELLDLEETKLSALPPEISQLTSLEGLDLTENQLSTLPPEISRLTGLQTLSLKQNKLSALPPEIGQLSSLEALDLSYNQLRTLPPEISRLTRLYSFFLNKNQLSTLPPEVDQLQHFMDMEIECTGFNMKSPDERVLIKDSLENFLVKYSPCGFSINKWHKFPPLSALNELLSKGEHKDGKFKWTPFQLTSAEHSALKQKMEKLLGVNLSVCLDEKISLDEWLSYALEIPKKKEVVPPIGPEGIKANKNIEDQLMRIRDMIQDETHGVDRCSELSEIIGHELPSELCNILHSAKEINSLMSTNEVIYFWGYNILSYEELLAQYKNMSQEYTFFRDWGVDDNFDVHGFENGPEYTFRVQFDLEGVLEEEIDIKNTKSFVPVFYSDDGGHYILYGLGNNNRFRGLLYVWSEGFACMAAPDLLSHIDDLLEGVRSGRYVLDEDGWLGSPDMGSPDMGSPDIWCERMKLKK
jgi:Leucine-rich repeat (LRR) protein